MKWWTTKVKESGIEEITYANGKVFESVEIPQNVLIDFAISHCRANGIDLPDSDDWYLYISSCGCSLNRQTA